MANRKQQNKREGVFPISNEGPAREFSRVWALFYIPCFSFSDRMQNDGFLSLGSFSLASVGNAVGAKRYCVPAVGARGTMCPPLEKCPQHDRITGLHTIGPFFVYSLAIPPPFYRQGNGAFLIKTLDSYIMCIYLPPYCDTIIKKRSHGQKEFLHFVAPCKYFDQIGIPPVPKHGTGGIPYILTFFEKESLNTRLFIFFTL